MRRSLNHLIFSEIYAILVKGIDYLKYDNCKNAGTCPGSWNDPYMLEVGNGGMAKEEYRYLCYFESQDSIDNLLLELYKPPPRVNDTNLYNVFRPREKAHRLHTRRVKTPTLFVLGTQDLLFPYQTDYNYRSIKDHILKNVETSRGQESQVLVSVKVSTSGR